MGMVYGLKPLQNKFQENYMKLTIDCRIALIRRELQMYFRVF
jgi:hypothetical protein